ncbi:ATP-binding protein [Anaerotalea alkaliphila]|uniref:histidine kinase n=1 Tax=Anaerotalea alkaliphila TaxID=2662126 RepID=A0A7X5KLZ1_9FIRM|nr:ATP-binding protein [Anaerotalea alkaliphila]NDL66419.1 cell wall metabolism sensor histidine kinase WalK [Anaerotalea alkaliphila]
MSKSIRWRLVMIYVLLVVIVMIASGSLIVWLTSSNEKQAIEEELRSSVANISIWIDTDKPVEEVKQDIQAVIQNAADYYSTKKVYLLDPEGNILYPFLENPQEYRFYTPQVMAAGVNRSLEAMDEVQLRGESTQYRGYAQPILLGEEVVYVIYVLAPVTAALQKLQDTLMVLLLSVVLAMAVSVVLGFVFSSFLTQPIIALTSKAREMALGNLNNPIAVHSDDEIGDLSKAFNTMASSLNEMLEQVSSEKSKLETVFHHMTDGILVFDREGRLAHSNPASEKMFQVQPTAGFREILGAHLGTDYPSIMEILEKPGQETAVVKYLVRLGETYLNLSFARYLDKNSQFKGIICVIQDITDHKKLEELQKEFVANVSHELRTPLTTIKSYAETLLDGALEDPETAKRFLEVINHEGDRMTTLVQDLLELSRLDNRNVRFSMGVLDLDRLIQENIDKYRIHAAKKLQVLEYQRPPGPTEILGDMNRIEQVLKNIVSNAVKYSPERTAIRLGLHLEKEWVVVRIQDNGIGIPEEDLPRVFERFYRVDKARSRSMGGTGLGLAIAKEIMEMHGGRIVVESVLGEGSSFRLYFPRTRVV